MWPNAQCIWPNAQCVCIWRNVRAFGQTLLIWSNAARFVNCSDALCICPKCFCRLIHWSVAVIKFKHLIWHIWCVCWLQFDPLLVESRQAGTCVLMLDSSEEDVVIKAAEAIYKFVEKCKLSLMTFYGWDAWMFIHSQSFIHSYLFNKSWQNTTLYIKRLNSGWQQCKAYAQWSCCHTVHFINF